MNKKILIIVSLFFTSIGSAQQVPFYNHYLINPFVYNPAYAGASQYINASVVRNQRFTPFGSTAVNNYLTVEGAFFKDKMGFGLMVAHQSQGVQQQLMSSLSYAYRLKINDDQNIRFAVSGGVLDNRIDYSELNAQDFNDPYLIGLRPTRPVFDMNVGVLYNWKDLKIGFSVPQIIGSKVKYAKDKGRGYYQLARHYMLSAEYDFKIGEKFIVKPNALVRYIPHAPIQYDVTAMGMYNNMVWLSATYKSDYAVQFNAGVRVFDFLRVGYSYELLIGKMRTYSTGMNHEVFLGFSFKTKKDKEKEIQIVEVEKIKEVQVLDPLAARQRDSVQVLKDELERKLKAMLDAQNAKRIKDSLDLANKPKVQEPVKPVDTTPVKPADPQEMEIPMANGYKFVNLDKSDSPDGFYVITGVFANKNNADMVMKNCSVDYPDTHLVINEANNFYYVVILHTLDKTQAVETFNGYKAKTKEKVWILNYLKN